MSHPQEVHIIGSGLAGSEAAFFLAERGISVVLHEMRPKVMTPAHETDHCAELVCSNSFKSKSPGSAPFLLKREMRGMGSLILTVAEGAEVPAGEAMAVDRHLFAQRVTEILSKHPKIRRVLGEVREPIPDAINLIATGPLTSDGLATWIASTAGSEDLYFYDAIAPIVETSSLDPARSFLANRYDKGDEDAYLNCPLSEAEYNAFYDALMAGEKVPGKPFEKEKFFQGCQPIEAIAATGRDSLRFGPMKPVGLTDPHTGLRPHAVLQLRPENLSRTAYNLVGFQTRLKYGEQARILRMIPALARAEFIRYGSIHRNTYVCGPKVLRSDLSLKGHPRIYFAGQITGVEGYLESAACGLIAAHAIWLRLRGESHRPPPANTALGALLKHIVQTDPKNYQPANVHFGLFDPAYFEGAAGKKKDQLRAMIDTQTQANFLKWWGCPPETGKKGA